MSIPRPEYPRPQYRREAWLNGNGPWQFCDDPADDGFERGLHQADALTDIITVPFCRESSLSGIHRTNRVLAVWYQRKFKLPSAWDGTSVWLHIGAADYETTIWCDGKEVARHEGGHVPISADLGACAGETINLTIRCRDDWRDAKPRGKQCVGPNSFGCFYTRTTGIWQTVWFEPVAPCHLQRPRISPMVDQGAFLLEQAISNWRPGLQLRAELHDDDGLISSESITSSSDPTPSLLLRIPKDRLRLWQPGQPHLYDLQLTLRDEHGDLIDRVESYAGLRSVAVHGHRVLINGHSVFQRLVLDQGYWPNGLLTAPSDAELCADIERGLAVGFNGARLHQKIFEERFLYHADRLGYLVWGELPDWICEANLSQADVQRRWDEKWLLEWQEALARDYSHPAIVGWCPLNEQEPGNEAQAQIIRRLGTALVVATQQYDRTRPVLDASGWPHVCPESDIYDFHDYCQDPDTLQQRYQALAETGQVELNQGELARIGRHWRHEPHHGQPFFLSEMGGIQWSEDGKSWGYGKAPKSLEEFYERFAGLVAVLLQHPRMFAYCYTQLTDVEFEQNGLYTADRRPKFDTARLAAAQTQPAAIEQVEQATVASKA